MLTHLKRQKYMQLVLEFGALITLAVEVANGERSAALIARPDSVAYFKNFAEKQEARAYNLQGDRSFYKRWHTTIMNNQRARRRPRGTERRATTGSLLGGEGEQRRQRFLAFHPISCSSHINWAESLVRVAPNEYVVEHELCTTRYIHSAFVWRAVILA